MALIFNDIDTDTLNAARDLMRQGLDLKQAATVLCRAVADLDIRLWRSIGEAPMPAQRHGPRHQKTSAKAQIESLLAASRLTVQQIAIETGRSLEYVRQIQNCNSRTNGDIPPAGDCDKHLEMVFAASPGGFYAKHLPAAYRVRA